MQHSFVIPGAPVPKERPRVGRGGRVFTPKRTLDAEQVVVAAYDGPTFEGPVTVKIVVWKDQTLVAIEDAPIVSKLRGDIDNYAKTILDGLQKAEAFANDKQIVDLVVSKR